MPLTSYALESMGYKALGPSESLTGTFTRVDVFVVEGITLDAPCLPSLEACINSVPFKMGLGTSLNEVCRQLVGDDYVDDEEQWKKDKRSSPPFLLLSFGPSREYVGSGTHFKESEELLETYDCFREAKKELKKQSDAVVPSLLTSLTLNFSSAERLVKFLPLSSAFCGKSKEGKKIFDWYLEVSGGAIACKRFDDNSAEERTASAVKIAKTFDRETAQFYYRGSTEKDPLKRFLHFFLCVERLVHSTFSKIEHREAVSSLLSGHATTETSGQKLLAAHRDSWKDLRNRFIWCVMHKWTHLSDADVEQFEQFKSVRDRISHGKQSAPDGATVTDIEAFVI